MTIFARALYCPLPSACVMVAMLSPVSALAQADARTNTDTAVATAPPPATRARAADGTRSASTAGSAAPAQAYTKPEDRDIVVTGLRGSLESAINARRAANGLTDSIFAKDIAAFPDTNLAESIQRIPGVQITRDAGEGRQIAVRGLNGDFTRVRLNGMEALATTGSSDQRGGVNRSRSFDLNIFASELFSRVDVVKARSASLDEGGIAATVDLHTLRPFDNPVSTWSRQRRRSTRPAPTRSRRARRW